MGLGSHRKQGWKWSCILYERGEKAQGGLELDPELLEGVSEIGTQMELSPLTVLVG